MWAGFMWIISIETLDYSGCSTWKSEIRSLRKVVTASGTWAENALQSTLLDFSRSSLLFVGFVIPVSAVLLASSKHADRKAADVGGLDSSEQPALYTYIYNAGDPFFALAGLRLSGSPLSPPTQPYHSVYLDSTSSDSLTCAVLLGFAMVDERRPQAIHRPLENI